MNNSRLNQSAPNVTALNSSRLNTTGVGAFARSAAGGGEAMPQPPDGYQYFVTASGKYFVTKSGEYFLVRTSKTL